MRNTHPVKLIRKAKPGDPVGLYNWPPLGVCCSRFVFPVCGELLLALPRVFSVATFYVLLFRGGRGDYIDVVRAEKTKRATAINDFATGRISGKWLGAEHPYITEGRRDRGKPNTCKSDQTWIEWNGRELITHGKGATRKISRAYSRRNWFRPTITTGKEREASGTTHKPMGMTRMGGAEVDGDAIFGENT